VLASVAATWTRSERRASSGAAWRRFDQEQPLTVQALASWRRGPLELGARVEIASGHPRTPVTGAVFDARRQRYDPLFGEQNSERLPTFSSLSVRAAWERVTRWGGYQLWLDVVNATNRRNVEEIVYAADYSARGQIVGLPILPVLGAEVSL